MVVRHLTPPPGRWPSSSIASHRRPEPPRRSSPANSQCADRVQSKAAGVSPSAKGPRRWNDALRVVSGRWAVLRRRGGKGRGADVPRYWRTRSSGFWRASRNAWDSELAVLDRELQFVTVRLQEWGLVPRVQRDTGRDWGRRRRGPRGCSECATAGTDVEHWNQAHGVRFVAAPGRVGVAIPFP